MVLEVCPPIAFQARPPVYALKRAHIRAVNLRCAKVSQPDSFILLAKLAAPFCTRFKALTWPSLYGSQHTAPYSISVSKLNFHIIISLLEYTHYKMKFLPCFP